MPRTRKNRMVDSTSTLRRRRLAQLDLEGLFLPVPQKPELDPVPGFAGAQFRREITGLGDRLAVDPGDHVASGDGEADRHRTPRRRYVGDVDADDPTGSTHERAARVTWRDRGIGLEQADERRTTAGDAALQAGDDPGCHRVL